MRTNTRIANYDRPHCAFVFSIHTVLAAYADESISGGRRRRRRRRRNFVWYLTQRTYTRYYACVFFLIYECVSPSGQTGRNIITDNNERSARRPRVKHARYFHFFFLQSDGSDTRKYVNAIIITWRFLICFHSPFARGLRFASTMDAVRGRRIRTEKRIHETIMLTRFCANRPHPPSSGGGDDGHGVVFCRRDSGEKTKTIVYILENYRFERTRTILHWGSIGDVTTVSRA